MADALPNHVRLKLERTLDQWRHWRPRPDGRPTALEPLAGGVSNFSVKVGSGDRQWAVRIDGAPPERLGLSRSAEWRAMRAAASRGLCPPPVYRNPQLGCLVTGFLPTDSAPAVDGPAVDDPAVDDPAAVAALLRGIHALPPVKFRLSPLHRAQRYLAVVGEHALPQGLVDACESLDADAPEPALCHNDLLRGNRLASGGRLVALDWEYAAVGDPLFDLAAVIEGDGLDDARARDLLEHWLDAAASAEQRRRLQLQRQVYRELVRLWETAFERLRQRGNAD